MFPGAATANLIARLTARACWPAIKPVPVGVGGLGSFLGWDPWVALAAVANGSVPRPRRDRVLVMDDDGDILLLAQRVLLKLGVEVALAEDGSRALSIYREAMQAGAPFDAVIADLSIPGGMGGEELARRLHAIDPAAKVVVSSGHTSDPAMVAAADHGFSGSIAKPYRLSELSRLLDGLIGQ